MRKVDFLDTVAAFIADNGLLRKEGLYLVGLSGGADSVALLLAMRRLGYRVEGVHCNFHLRGKEADRDEAFCRDLCRKWEVPLHTVHFDTLAYVEVHHVSVEMAARQLRYDYFERLRTDMGAEDILVAHHMNDSVETVLINMVRGTGLHGLCGIQPRNGHVVRPLLCVDRSMILDFLQSEGQDFITDSSNLVPDVMRNKIRLQVIPLLEQINPSFIQGVSDMAFRLKSAAALLDGMVEQVIDGARRESAGREVEAYGRSVLSNDYVGHALLSRYHFSPAQCAAICQNRMADTGTLYESATHQLLFDRDNILIQPLFVAPKPLRLPVDGKYVLQGDDRLRLTLLARPENMAWSADPNTASLDADRVEWPLTIRVADKADRFRPLGMRGTKLLSDFLTDRKMNRFAKMRQLVVTDAQNRILWVVGLRIDDRYKVTDDTRNLLRIEFFQETTLS